uniref:Uncharacterized protein n=1 Tax=Eutreptiella gymnastica TaxID=73025 RepID=A0A7S4CNF5_9EUGL
MRVGDACAFADGPVTHRMALRRPLPPFQAPGPAFARPMPVHTPGDPIHPLSAAAEACCVGPVSCRCTNIHPVAPRPPTHAHPKKSNVPPSEAAPSRPRHTD